jgi:nicotinate-nucleotide adenylyltransferase
VDGTRLGLFGGTFDPPHLGHVAALRAAWRTGSFDQILVTVAGQPYTKAGTRAVSPAAMRLAMAHAAFDELDGVTVSDREIRRGGATYTIDTVRELCAEGFAVTLLVGADAAATLAQWRDARELATLVNVGVFPRVGAAVTLSSPWRTAEIAMDPVDLSSTWIREHDDAAIAGLLPAGVVPLYRGAGG